MKRITRYVILAVICLLLWAPRGMAAETIDATSFETYQKSLLDIYNSLEGNKKKLLFKAAGYYEALFKWGFEAGVEDPQIMQRTQEIMQSFSGKTADDLINTYVLVVQQNHDMASAELEQAKKLIEDAKIMNAAIKAFEILDAQFYYQNSGGKDLPMIGLAVYNDSPYVIAHIYLRARVWSPGRVWFDDEFNFSVPDGVPKGEMAEWELLTDPAADWDTIPKRDDLSIALEVVKLVTVDGLEIVAYELPPEQDEYLDVLTQQIEVFRKELAELQALAQSAE